MKTSEKNIVIIPARGGSKGIPRKNLRPLGGFPLISYSIKAALQSDLVDTVVVTTDDDEIALLAERFGAYVIMRPAHLADDSITLDPVIQHAFEVCEQKFNVEYKNIATVQPTSPLIRSEDIDAVFLLLQETHCDTAQTVVDDRHLCWGKENNKAFPLYKERVNRQSLPQQFKETGAVIACSREQLLSGSRIGNHVELHEVPQNVSFDIDTFADLYLCEAMLSRKLIVFTVVGYATVGLGHAFRTIMLAHELVQYDLLFICEESSDLAIDYIKSNNYTVQVCANGELANAVIDQKPSLVINDILDTDESYMMRLKNEKLSVINFEDLGPGHKLADIVINALYPHQIPNSNMLVGAKYFCLRDEFLYINKAAVKSNKNVSKILITFGGVDEGDLTLTALKEIAHYCSENQIEIEIIVGPGYKYSEGLNAALNVIKDINYSLISSTKRISEHMLNADVAITSAGRTVLELAALKVPMIVICQNIRETTHTFASSENGILNLGYRNELNEGEILNAFIKVVEDLPLRNIMIEKMKELNFENGKSRVISKIKSLIN